MTDSTRKPDRRIQRTRKLLSTALMELIVERGYDSITIQDIADRADVNRSTFYLHYQDKEELLYDTVRDMIGEVLERMKVRATTRKHEDERIFNPADIDDFEHVARHGDFYRVMLGSKGSAGFYARIHGLVADAMREELHHWCFPREAKPGEPRIPLEFMAHYVAGAEISIMLWWLENGMPYPPEQMARMMHDLSVRGLWWGIGGDGAVPEG
jgi:AcrR family transcriptional regulator